MAREVTKKPVRKRTQSREKGGGDVSPVQKLSIKSKIKKEVPKGKRIHAKLVPEGKRVKILIADNTKKLEKRVEKKQEKKTGGGRQIIARSNLELALLSPFRFPMPQERVLGSVARYVGVFFVLVGAIFSLVNLEYATGTFANMGGVRNQAQTVDGTAGTATPGGTTVNDTTTTVDPTPDVRIIVEGQTTMLTNMAVLMINVPSAGEVKLVAEHKNGALIQLGSAFRVDASTWRFYWDTRQYPDGEYRLRVAVINQYGPYEHKDSMWRLVDNVSDTVPDNTTTTNTTQTVEGSSGTTDTGALVIPDTEAVLDTPNETEGSTTTEEEQAVALPAPVLKTATLRVLESSPLVGGAPLRILVDGGTATAVKVYAKSVLGGTLYYVGQGTYQSGTNEWYLDWNTNLVPDGDYVIRAKVTWSDQTTLDSSTSERSVKNNPTAPAVVASSTVVAATSSATLNPTIETKLSKASPVSGFVDVSVRVSDAVRVGVYAQKKDSLTPFFVGGAQRISSTDWKYQWSTTQTPNGDYNLYVRVETSYGTTEGKRISVRVQNEVIQTFTEEQEDAIDTLTDAGEALIQTTDDAEEVVLVERETETGYIPPKVVYVESVSTFIETVDTSDDEREEIEALLINFRTRLSEKLSDLARAKRSGDEEALRAVRTDIENFRDEVRRELEGGTEKREILDRINTYISQVTSELEELTLKNEAILKERVGDALTKDSDKDGITDYDEINIYFTNPFAADTDGDSYIDSVEIKLGYNPLDARSEALVTYESPKEMGIVREDLLAVDSITTLGETEREETSEELVPAPKKALISGKGLPNSFVTLYIYSTPIVLTVKTDAEGSWSYVFDKELEEGAHEVYVGITDNAGRIVAKSNPLPFVKTAVAFNEAEAAAAPIEVSPEPTLIDERIMLLVASIAVVGLGLVLILLGLHVRGRQEDSVLAPST